VSAQPSSHESVVNSQLNIRYRKIHQPKFEGRLTYFSCTSFFLSFTVTMLVRIRTEQKDVVEGGLW